MMEQGGSVAEWSSALLLGEKKGRFHRQPHKEFPPSNFFSNKEILQKHREKAHPLGSRGHVIDPGNSLIWVQILPVSCCKVIAVDLKRKVRLL